MNGPGDIPLTHNGTPDTRPCGLISIIPTLGMSSCRGRAEAFARRLSSKLRVLGTQTDDDPTSQEEDEPIINGTTNTWLPPHDTDNTVTDLQPLRHESDSFFDFDCELESPGSPVDECEYLRLIETASNTPHNSAAESGYVCASAASSHCSSDGNFYTDAASNTDNTQQRTSISVAELPEYVKSLKINGDPSVNDKENVDGDNGGDDTPKQLSNGDNDEQQASTIIVEYKNDATTTKTPSGPDVDNTLSNKITTTPAIDTAEGTESSLSTTEMIRKQNDILSELQKQSENYSNNLNENATNDIRTEQQEVITPNLANTTTQTDIVHKITNGHTDGGEDEVLKIELTEIEQNVKQQEQIEQKTNIILEQITNNETVITTTIESASPIKIGGNDKNNNNKENDDDNKKPHRNSGLDTTDDEDDCRPQRVRRCSSLKTGKTPPGTPGRKKIVRFADVLGLDLADVKTFLDEIPTIPKSAFEDLEVMESEPPIQLGPKSDKFLMPLFQQPGGLPTFLDIVREKQVSLENAAVTDTINQTINGSVRVRNLDFHKSVHIRYSLDHWRSFADLQANYVENSCDGFSDKFTFILFGNTLHVGQRLEFAVRFQCKGQQFWDNNYGANYCFQCLPTSTTTATSTSTSLTTNPIHSVIPQHHADHIVGMLSPTAGEAWCSSFY